MLLGSRLRTTSSITSFSELEASLQGSDECAELLADIAVTSTLQVANGQEPSTSQPKG